MRTMRSRFSRRFTLVCCQSPISMVSWYVKVASGDANPVNRRVHPLLEQVPGLGMLWEYEQAEPCGAYDAMDRAISSLTYRSPTGPKDPAYPAGNLGRQPGT